MISQYLVMKKSHYDSISDTGVRGDRIAWWKSQKEGKLANLNDPGDEYGFIELCNEMETLPDEIKDNIVDADVIDGHYDFPENATDTTIIRCDNFTFNNFKANSLIMEESSDTSE